jgi:NAD(P)H dehydrogenase (quinone)
MIRRVFVMLLITGATGQLGTAVVRQLLACTDSAEIAVLVRDPGKAADLQRQGVSVRVGDYGDAYSLARAMKGIDRVLLFASNQYQQRMRQHQNVIDAARAADVELLGFTSRSLGDMTGSQNAMMRDYFETEERIRQSGVPAVIFRNALYLDTLPVSLGGPAVFAAGIRVPAGHGAVAYALRRELGEATANAMLDHSGGDRTYVLAAPRAYTFEDVANALSEIAGSTVTYISVSDDDFVAHATGHGVPEPMARHLVGFFADVRHNLLDQTSTDLHTLLGREPASLKDGLAELFVPQASGTTAVAD